MCYGSVFQLCGFYGGIALLMAHVWAGICEADKNFIVEFR